MQPAGCKVDDVVEVAYLVNVVTVKLRLQVSSADYMPDNLAEMKRQVFIYLSGQNNLIYLSDNYQLATDASKFHLDWGFVC